MTIQRNAAAIVRARLRATQPANGATISRGAESCGDVVVVMGRTGRVADPNGDFRIEANAQEVLIASADYSPTGFPSDPEAGDVITVSIEGVSVRFEVRPPGGNQPAFEYADSEWKELRVHCRRVDSVPATE